MKNLIKVTFVCLVVVAGCFALTGGAGSAAATPVEELSTQASVYRANCARCHGADGHANTPAGRETDADDLTTGKVKGLSTARMTQIIKNGKGDMPAFGKKLSAAQIAGVIRYVKSL
jgi:mono/diheme cytochrome c family protein